MSSLATAPERASEPAGATQVSRDRRLGLGTDAALAVLIAAALAAVVFVTAGGTDLARDTWAEIALLAIAAGCVCAAAVLVAPRMPRAGAAAVALFAALAALSYLSIAWSVQPATSWVEANRTLAYLAAFAAAAILARLAPRRWPAVLGGVGIMTVGVCGYALLAEVFPATLNASDTLGRLWVPFGYWNATGLLAAMGLPVCLWAGTRPATGRVLRSLTVPGLAVLLTTLTLSYSRGALFAAAIGVGCWIVLTPLRLRAALLLALGGIGGAVATGWALAHHAITHAGASLAARTAAGHDFGIVLIVVLVLSAVAGFVATREMDRTALPEHIRRRIGTALVILLALIPFAALAGAAGSSRGLTGEISHVWNTLTSTTANVGNGPSRLADLSNSRPLYWSEGLKVGEHAPLAGVGAGGFATARTRYTNNGLPVTHAHSYVIETFADFGLIGIAVSLALLVAWGMAVRRTLGGLSPPRGAAAQSSAAAHPPDAAHTPDAAQDPIGAEWNGMVTLVVVAVIFGVSSLIDWTWFIPGVAVPAFVCAGWVAARGSLTDPVPARAQARTRLPLGRVAAATAALATALIVGWFVWQPLHSSDQVSAAITAMTRGDTSAAIAAAKGAADSDPVSVDPVWELGAIYSAIGQKAASRAEYVKATQIQPSNPATWQQLGSVDLQANRRHLAVGELYAALRLFPASLLLKQLIGLALFGPPSGSHARTGSA